MADPSLVHVATLIRLDVATNALVSLLSIARDLRADLGPAIKEAGHEEDLLCAISEARCAIEVARGTSTFMPETIRTQRMPHDLALRILEEEAFTPGDKR